MNGCYYNEPNEEEMISILQSFVDIAEPQLYKYDNLREDVEANKWAINKIKELKKERDYYKERYNEFNNAFIEGGKKLTKK